MSDILILGYYGFKNSGDDALLLSVIQQLTKRKNDIRLTVLSNDTEETKRNYSVPAIGRYNIFSLLKNIITTKMLLVGGGTLIQDGTSTKSLLYYLFVIRLAQIFNKKVMLYANGIGPLKEENYRITKKILNRVNVITLRDNISLEELNKIGVTKPEIILTADSAFNMELSLSKKNPLNIKKDYFCLSVRSYEKIPDNFEDIMSEICDYIYNKYHSIPILIPFQKVKDSEISNNIQKKTKCKSIIFDTDCKIEELFDILSGAKLCIGMRLHSLIYSSICNVPSIGIVYDPKIVGFMEYIGQSRYIDAESPDINSMKQMIDYCFESYDIIKKELADNMENMKKKAEMNSKIAIQLLCE